MYKLSWGVKNMEKSQIVNALVILMDLKAEDAPQLAKVSIKTLTKMYDTLIAQAIMVGEAKRANK